MVKYACLLGDKRILFFGGTIVSMVEMMVRTLEEFESEAARFAKTLAPSRRLVALSSAQRGATLVTLSGELGAGKTAFTKAVAKELGIEGIVNSPTFVLEKIYQLPREHGGETATFARLVHIDAYRLESGRELASIGFEELMQDAENLVMLEWPEKVQEALPQSAVQISIIAHPDGSRTISYG